MYIDTFKVFSDLAETKSFSKAAALNGITQSAVSQQIRALEIKFQVTLIERSRKACALTSEGKAFLDASREILDVYDSLGDRLHELRNVVAGELRVASIFSIGLHELPPRLKAFRTSHPDIDVHVEYRRSGEVYSQVLSGEVDLGLVAYPQYRAGLKFEIFEEDELVLICHPNHPLTKRGKVALTDLSGERFIAFEPDVPTRKVIDRHLRDHRVALTHTVEFDNVEMVKRAVEIESGVSLVPRNTVTAEVQTGALRVIRLEGERLVRPLGVIYKRTRSRSPVHKIFIATLRSGMVTPEPAPHRKLVPTAVA
jgi:DNA-binding transcriptional LysR family regulator